MDSFSINNPAATFICHPDGSVWREIQYGLNGEQTCYIPFPLEEFMGFEIVQNDDPWRAELPVRQNFMDAAEWWMFILKANAHLKHDPPAKRYEGIFLVGLEAYEMLKDNPIFGHE